MDLLTRVQTRLGLTDSAPDGLLQELIQTVSDRLCLRLGVSVLPALFYSIAVDAVVKAYRRLYYEGISNESVSGLSNSFYEDILKEYDTEIGRYRESEMNSGNSSKVVHFL